MPKFVIAHASLFDNEMHIEFVEAEDAFSAAKRFLHDKGFNALEEVKDLSDFYRLAFDCDLLLGVEKQPHV